MPQAQDVMNKLIRKRVFSRDNDDYNVWKNAAPDEGRLIWEAKTQTMKMSSFAEDFFRDLRDATGLEMLLTKGEFHRLVEWVEPGTVAGEFVEKLNLLAELFLNAAAFSDTP